MSNILFQLCWEDEGVIQKGKPHTYEEALSKKANFEMVFTKKEFWIQPVEDTLNFLEGCLAK